MEINQDVTSRLRAARGAFAWAFDPRQNFSIAERWTCLRCSVVLVVKAIKAIS